MVTYHGPADAWSGTAEQLHHTFLADKRGRLYAPVRNEFACDKLEYGYSLTSNFERAIHGHRCDI
jgi:hypothetical protein